MASWLELKQYVKSNYKVSSEDDFALSMIFSLDDGRSQVVHVFHQTLGGGSEEWAAIESVVGPIGEVPLEAVLREVGQKVCGGIGFAAEFVTYRHAIPLANLDINEFERPLALVTMTADDLEAKFVGGDRA